MDKTKKQFKVYLNKKYGFIKSNTGFNKIAKAHKRLYGDFLYDSDKEYFNVHYQLWLNGEDI